MRKRTLITSAIVSVALCACGAPTTLASKGHAPLSADEVLAAQGSSKAGSAGNSKTGASVTGSATGSASTANSAGGSATKRPGGVSSAATDAQVGHGQATQAAAARTTAAATTAAKTATGPASSAGSTASQAPAIVDGATTTATTSATGLTPANTASAPQPAAAGASTTWKTVFTDDFSGSSLSSSWWDYNGLSSASGSYFRPQNVTVANGSLVLTSTKVNGVWAGAGVGQRTNLKYGRWLIRGKIDKGHGVTFVGLLWPLVGWPPEIDFAEDNGGDRNMMLGTVHYVGGSQTSKTLSSIDSTQWHTYGVEWTPGKVVYTVDGRVWATTAAGNTPSQTMRLGLQTEPWTKGTNFFHSIDSSTPSAVHMYIDSVTIQSYGG